VTNLRDDVLRTLAAWNAPSPEQDDLRHAFVGFVLAREDATWRSCVPGHVTASAVLLDHERTQVALVLHRIVRLWVVPGGHLEAGDRRLADAAAREVAEETGVEARFDPVPLELSCHAFTCRNSPPTRHYDVAFVGVADPSAQLVVSDESHDVRWWPVGALPEPLARRMPRTIGRALQRVR